MSRTGKAFGWYWDTIVVSAIAAILAAMGIVLGVWMTTSNIPKPEPFWLLAPMVFFPALMLVIIGAVSIRNQYKTDREALAFR